MFPHHSETGNEFKSPASSDARATGVHVKSLAEALAAEAESLDAEVRRFLGDVQAA